MKDDCDQAECTIHIKNKIHSANLDCAARAVCIIIVFDRLFVLHHGPTPYLPHFHAAKSSRAELSTLVLQLRYLVALAV